MSTAVLERPETEVANSDTTNDGSRHISCGCLFPRLPVVAICGALKKEWYVISVSEKAKADYCPDCVEAIDNDNAYICSFCGGEIRW